MKTLKLNVRLPFLALCTVGFMGLLTFTSCEKEDLTTTDELIENENGITFRDNGDGDVDYGVAEALLAEINLGAITVDEELGSLHFASDADLAQTMEMLEAADQALDEEIASSLAGLSEDEIDGMDINDDFAFETFEGNFPGFNSFRAMVAQLEEEFFANEELNDENDPTDQYDAIPDALGAVLNTSGEVISKDDSEFEKQVHVARLDGGNYTVLDGDMETTLQIRGGAAHEELAAMPNIRIVDEPGSGGGSPESSTQCRSNKSRSATHYIYQSGKKKYRAKIKVRVQNFSFLWWNIHRGYSELKSRRKSGWFWKKHYTVININQKGNLYPSTYASFPCTQYYYDYNLQMWIPYETICTYEYRCNGEAVSAASSGSTWNWRYSRVRNYNFKVSASNKDGASGVLRATFKWKGQTYNLSVL